ncbi:MAG TPA: IPT/TIG domain-containing protein [Cyclobacteriaceae bacterium]|nr:IPT/TIG domain-containing protein [Cyclobacteriaceae bacterium]
MKIIASVISMLCILSLVSCAVDDKNPTPPEDKTLRVTSLSSTTVHYGDTLVIDGSNFSATAANNTITINGITATVIAASTKSLEVTIPAASVTNCEVKVEVAGSIVIAGNITYVPDVFVAGYESNGATSIAKYWKNEKAIALSQNESALNAICVNDNGVYVAGWERINNLQLANFWKNGTKTTLGTGASAVYAMAVNGTEVYTGGFEIIDGFDLPRYWQNSTGTTVNVKDPIISKDVLGNGACSGISYSNNTVYAVGSYRNSQGRFSPWETTNGEVPAETIPNNDKHCFANGAFLYGTDKYVVGNQNSPTTGLAMATIWKNGSYTLLTDGDNSVGVAKAVVVVGNDVYVAGYEQENYSGGGLTFAKYWKNGVPVKLSTANSNATGIAVFDNDVYVTGWENNGTQNVVKYWKNGTSVSLTDGTFTSAGNSIFLR